MMCECGCDTCFMGHLGRRIRWKHSFLRLTQLEFKVRSKSDQIRLSLRTQNFLLKACLSCPVLPQNSKISFILMYAIRNVNNISKISKNSSWRYSEAPALRSNYFSLQYRLTICNRLVLQPLVKL